jgi:hypothetical protein
VIQTSLTCVNSLVFAFLLSTQFHDQMELCNIIRLGEELLKTQSVVLLNLGAQNHPGLVVPTLERMHSMCFETLGTFSYRLFI